MSGNKRQVIQNLFSLLISKVYLSEFDIITLRSEFGSPVLYRQCFHLIHSIDTHIQIEQSGNIIHHLTDRSIHTRPDNHKYKIGKQINRTRSQEIGTNDNNACQSEFQYTLGTVYQHAEHQFITSQYLFIGINARIQFFQIVSLLIVGFYLLNGIESFLDMLGHHPLVQIITFIAFLYFLLREKKNCGGKRHYPEQSNRQLPVIKCHADGNKQNTDNGSKQLGNRMRESMLEISAVIHNRGGEVGKILFAKESQRQLAKFFRQ